jgi:hypothetical protein
VRQFMEAGKMTAVIDKTFPLSRVPEASTGIFGGGPAKWPQDRPPAVPEVDLVHVCAGGGRLDWRA